MNEFIKDNRRKKKRSDKEDFYMDWWLYESEYSDGNKDYTNYEADPIRETLDALMCDSIVELTDDGERVLY